MEYSGSHVNMLLFATNRFDSSGETSCCNTQKQINKWQYRLSQRYLNNVYRLVWNLFWLWLYHTIRHRQKYMRCFTTYFCLPDDDLWLTFWHQSFTFNSNKSPTWCNNFSVYCPDICLQLNMFRAFSRPSSGAKWLQWQPLVLPSYRGDSRAVFVVGPAGPVSLFAARS